jgi:FkbM family methyltransferase
MNPVPALARLTRWLQARQPARPLRGITRFTRAVDARLPAYRDDVRLPSGVIMPLDNRVPAQQSILYSGVYDVALAHVIRQYITPGAHALDIGANLGFFALHMAQWAGANGRVAAFEANPAMLAAIRRALALNPHLHIDLLPNAIHAENGTLTFHIDADPGKSSLLADQVRQPLRTLNVAAITVDHYLSTAGWSRLDVIKCDIEGGDCYALLGARATLTRFRPLVAFEYHDGMPAAAEAFALLDGLGYRLRELRLNGEQRPFDPAAAHPQRSLNLLALPG